MRIALAGGHRTGKTTLAEAVSNETGLPFMESNVGSIFEKYGIQPDKDFSFRERMVIQVKIIHHIREQWSEQESFICDRSPLDFLAYTMFDVTQKGLDSTDFRALKEYTHLCFTWATYFDAVVLVQPGIPLVADHNKPTAAVNTACIEVINTLVGGLLQDERCDTATYSIPREIVDLEQRVDSVISAGNRTAKDILINSLPDKDNSSVH